MVSDQLMPVSPTYRPDPRYVELGDGLFDEVEAAPFPKHLLRFRNQRWAARVGLDRLTDDEWLSHFGRFEPLERNLRAPLALRYHGHQFDVYNAGLGDGRGFLFAQLRDEQGRLLDLGTKGSGRTPYSRGGDGRLTLKGGVREVLATEMLEALGVPTSKSFSLIETGEMLMRGDEPSPTRSSVLVRLSHSHVRFGTFQRLAAEGDVGAMGRLIDYCVDAFYPEVADEKERAVALLAQVSERTGHLVGRWMAAGFVHGVLNSDNMNITGESFDYGPYRFLPHYDPNFTAAYFDSSGLYAYGEQPRAVKENLLRLAQALSSLSPMGALRKATERFQPALEKSIQEAFVERLGLCSLGPDEDGRLVDMCFTFMADTKIGFEQFFFDLFGGSQSRAATQKSASPHYRTGGSQALLRQMEQFKLRCDHAQHTPYRSGEEPETLLIDEIERIWDSIARIDNWDPFHNKVAAIRRMGAECTRR